MRTRLGALTIIIARRFLPLRVRRYLSGKLEKQYFDLYEVYDRAELEKEFHARISQVNPNAYIDVSCQPDLNVIIVVVDSLRNSHLSCRGYFRDTTPFLDSFKARFTAISAASWTYPSVASILTGLYPHNHNASIRVAEGNTAGNQGIQERKIRGEILTLPEMLFCLGYQVYFGSAINLAFDPVRGRVIPDIYAPTAGADRLLGALLRWVSTTSKKFFAYVQLADLHAPLNPPDPYKGFFGRVKQIPDIDKWDFRRPLEQKLFGGKFREYKENRVLLYDNTLRYVDSAIERFRKSLEDMGLVDSTVLVVTADHGDEFWEHSELEAKIFHDPRGYYGTGHGHSVFSEIIEVPLLMSGPVPPKQSLHFVSTVDIMPTVADLLGIKHYIEFDGRNIFESEQDRFLLSEGGGYGYEKKALIFDRYKLVCSKDDGVELLFNLENDPAEQHPIADREVISVFMDRLDQMLKRDEERKLRGIVRKKGLSNAANG